MSVAQLVASSGGAAPGVGDWLAAARDRLARAASQPVGSSTEDDLVEGLRLVGEVEARAAALRGVLLAELDRRGAARAAGHTGTDAWVASLTGTTRAEVAGNLRLAQALQDRWHATRDAFATGLINQAQTRAVVRACRTLPEGLPEADRRAAEQGLVAKAVAGMDARGLRQAGRRMLEVVSRACADRHEADQLAAEAARAERETYLSLGDNGDGTWSGRFTIPEVAGVMLRHALDRLTAPRRLSRDADGRPVVDASVDNGLDTLPFPERMGRGLVELIEHLPTEGFGGVAATLVLTMDLDRLREGLGSAVLDGGARLGAGDVRRLACDAGLVPAVLGSRSEMLDLGERARLHSTAQRRAYHALYETCAVVGCERPVGWCEIHHRTWWSRGGRTDLDNGVPLCGYHHQRAHDDQFDLDCTPGERARTWTITFRRRRRRAAG